MNLETLQLGDFLTLKRGYDLPAAKRREGEVPIVSSSGITGHHSVSKVQSPGVVTGRYGTLGEVFFVNEDYWPLNTALYVQNFKGSDPKYAFYFLKSILKGTASDKAAVPGVNRNDLHARWVRATRDIHQQRLVASILSAYDDLIENNRRRIQLLEQAARLLYKEWFVHLRFPGHEHVPIVDGVPEGWELRTIGDLVEDESLELQTGPFGTQLKASEYTDTGTPVINVRNIGYGEIRPEKLEFLPDQKVMSLAKHVLAAGDIVFGRKGAVDRHVLVGPGQDGWVQGSDCIRMRITGPEVTPQFLSVAFREDRHKQWMLSQCGNKATMASLNQEVIGRIPLLSPSPEVLYLFDDYISHQLAQTVLLQRQSDAASAARDLLLPRLMKGEIPV